MKKRLAAILVAVLLAALLFGCSTQAPPQVEAVPTQAPAEAIKDASGVTNSGKDGTLPDINPGNVAASGKKIIYTVEMAIEAKDAAAAINDITATVTGLGGYVSNSQFNTDEDGRQTGGYITVRVAPEKLNELTKHIGTLGKVISQSLGSSDVTASYTDTELRLTNALAQEAALLEIMKKAEKIEDILAVRRELGAVQQEIEQYKGSLRQMDNQVGYSTVNISIRQPEPPAVVVDPKPDPGVQFWGFEAVWQKIARGFSDSFNWTLNAISGVLMALAYVSMPLLLIAIVVVGIIVLVKVLTKKKKQVK